jgi:transposase
VERVSWAAHDSRFTHEFEQMTAWLAQRMDKTATCKLMGINWRTVGTIIERVVAARLDPARLDELYVIGVDELSFRRHHEYVTVVVDHLKKRVVWVGEGKGEKTLQQFFDEVGPERSQALTHVTMDLGAAYQAAVEARAPQAQKVFDRFHVQKLANEALDTVRRQEVGLLGGSAEPRRRATRTQRPGAVAEAFSEEVARPISRGGDEPLPQGGAHQGGSAQPEGQGGAGLQGRSGGAGGQAGRGVDGSGGPLPPQGRAAV